VCTAATLFKTGIAITSAGQAALSLKPLAGEYAFLLFGLGLFGASVLAVAVIPLSTAYAICEAFGWESGVDNRYREAPAFYGIYGALIALGSLLILIPGVQLIQVILVTQQIAGLLCPVILTFMILLVNDRSIMGDHVNRRLQNIVSWATVVFIIMLSLILFVSPLLGH
jgi:Mn2+/Fe2+ NRAMP family transporter